MATYVDFVPGTPLLIQIFIIFLVLPVLGVRQTKALAGIVALAFNATGYIAEIVRGTVGSVNRGQAEAARSVGLTEPRILVHVLPQQALRPMLPAPTNELITLIKNSPLLSVIPAYELTRAGQAIVTTYFVPLELYVLPALFHYAVIVALLRLSRLFEQRLPAW